MKAFFQNLKPSSEKAYASLDRATEPTVISSGLTVVELFQSQGCSSCPPTNANVLRLLEDPNLLILTYHVTYWDRLGWKDTFGRSTFDQRQWVYARALQRKNVYTPQVVVNGQIEGVGNNARDLQNLITTGSAFSATRTIEIYLSKASNAITVSGPSSEHGMVTMVEYDPKMVDVPILRGENGGRTLPHSNIVKNVARIGSWNGGSQDFGLPQMSKEDGLKRAIIVSAGSGGAILGVIRI